MKIAAIASLFICGSLASPFSDSFVSLFGPPKNLVPRSSSLSIIETNLYNISNLTAALGKEISTFQVSQLLALNAATAASLDAITVAEVAIKPVAPLDIKDAEALTTVILQLSKVVNQTITTTINQKQAFGGASPVVLASLQQQQAATVQLNSLLATKIPKSLVSLSAQLSAPIFQSLNMGIAVFEKPNVDNETSQTTPNAASSTAAAGYGTLVVAALAAIAISVGI